MTNLANAASTLSRSTSTSCGARQERLRSPEASGRRRVGEVRDKRRTAREERGRPSSSERPWRRAGGWGGAVTDKKGAASGRGGAGTTEN